MSEPPFDLITAVLESLNVLLLDDVGSLMSLLSNCKIYYGPMTRLKIEKNGRNLPVANRLHQSHYSELQNIDRSIGLLNCIYSKSEKTRFVLQEQKLNA
jgi:hypothetical protein